MQRMLILACVVLAASADWPAPLQRVAIHAQYLQARLRSEMNNWLRPARDDEYVDEARDLLASRLRSKDLAADLFKRAGGNGNACSVAEGLASMSSAPKAALEVARLMQSVHKCAN